MQIGTVPQTVCASHNVATWSPPVVWRSSFTLSVPAIMEARYSLTFSRPTILIGLSGSCKVTSGANRALVGSLVRIASK